MDTYFRAGGIGTATADRPIRAVLATPGRKADGIDLVMAGCQLERFYANPVILQAHRSSELPIGRVSDIRISDAEISGELTFAKGDPVGERVENLVRQGILNAVSVGFDLLERPDSRGRVGKWSLVELSMVSVGMDEKALVTSRAAGPGTADARALLDALDVVPVGAQALLDALDDGLADLEEAALRDAVNAQLRRVLRELAAEGRL